MYIDHHIKQVGKVLTCTDSSGKIVVNKYDNKTSRIIFDLDGTIPGKLYFALLNPTTNKYFLTPINNNEIEITSAISVYPGLWSAIIIGADVNYEIIDNNIDQTKLTYISDEFKKIVVRDNFLNELNIEESQSPANLFDFLSEAQGYVVLSKRYAVGDEKIEGSDVDNAKYYMNETKKLLNNFEGTVKDTVVEVVENQMDILDNEIKRIDSELNQALSETNQFVEELNDELYHFKINTEERIKTLEELDIDVDITVDSELNPESENPIQNKAVAKAVDDLKSETSSLRSDLEKKQPVGDYALRSEIPSIPVESVNGKTGAVVLNATDVGAVTYEEFANFNVNYGNHSHTAEEIGAATSDEVSLLRSDLEKKAEKSEITSHNTSKESHTDIRSLIDGLAARLNALANSDDTTLDQMAEVVAYIKSNKSLIDAITTSKVNVSDIIDNLTTSASNKPLSAKQGVALKALIDAITIPVKSVNGKTGAVSLTATDVGAASATEFAKVKSDFNEHTGNTTSHVTATEKEAWNNKSNFSGSYNDLSNKPTIPTKTSQLTNDSRFLTRHQSLSGYAKTSDIPTKTSQLINDSKFLTGYTETDPTVPAWAKAATKPTYTAAEVGAATQAYVDAETAKLKSDFMELEEQVDSVTKGVGSQNINIGDYVVGGLENGTLKTGWSDCLATRNYIETKPNKTLVYAYGTDGKNFIYVAEYDKNKVFIKQTTVYGYMHTGVTNQLVLSGITKYIKFYASYGAGNTPPISSAQFGLYYLDNIPDPFVYTEYKPQTFVDFEKVYYGDEPILEQIVLKEREKAVVLFNFDAGNIYDIRATKLEEFGWNGTFCSNEHNQANVKQFVQHGHDIAFYKGKYTENVPSSYTSEDSYESWYNYIKGGVDELNALGVYFPTLYGSAGHKGGLQMFNACKALGFKYVSCSYELVSGESWETDNDCRWFNNETNSPYEMGLKPTGMNKTVDELRTILNTAVDNKQVVSLFTHGVEDTPTSSINISTEHYVDILNLVKEFVDANTIEVMTMREFYNKYHHEDGRDLDFKRTMSALMDLKSS